MDAAAAVIRLATTADRDDLVALLAAQLAEHDIPLAAAGLENAIDGALADPARAFMLVARAGGGAAVGIAYVSYIWTLEHGGRSAWLDELYVVPARRGAGLGTRLLHEVIARTAAAGCGALDLEVEESHTRAAQLYAREGFVAHARARWVRRLREAE